MSQPPPDKQYGAYKVSEYSDVQGKQNYRVDESSGVPARADTSK